tara:strand:+ start:7724 stop:8443 length:720 start_codon:yes stop_codon:yes gene_type:complete
MARGTTLAILINDLRSEIGHSLQPNLGRSTRDVHINVLQRTQRRLWEDYAWPFLRVFRDIDISANQRYYNLPSDITFERIEKVEFKHGDYWTKMEYGIGADQYNQFDSDRGITSYPISRYDTHENDQIELWPIPSTNSNSTSKIGMVRFHGIKNLGGLINETDKADLDDQLIILYAAAEILARQKQADAQNKLAQAQAHYNRLKARLAKTETFVIGGGEPEGMYRPKDPPLIATTNTGN